MDAVNSISPTMYSIVFIVGTKYDRAGAEEDTLTITETFKRLFNAEVHDWIDSDNGEVFKTNMHELKTSDIWLNKFKEAKFVAIFCLAHGKANEQAQLSRSREVFDIKRTLLNPFFKIKELEKKLKWLVIQSCRGKLNDLQLDTDATTSQLYYLDHYYVSYCTEEGTTSYQPNLMGKVFIQKLCSELQRNANTKTLDVMLTNVTEAVTEYALEKKLKNYSIPNFIKNAEFEHKFYDRNTCNI